MEGLGGHILKCIECGSVYEPAPLIKCSECGGLLDIIIELPDRGLFRRLGLREMGVWRYRELLPVGDGAKVVSLGEGGTRLLKLEEEFTGELFIKLEGDNPTGSFKDRGMTVGVTKALEFGYRKVACASTGNTSASLAAYAARGGLDAYVFIPKGGIAKGKLFQALAYGANIVEVEGGFDDALERVLKYVEVEGDVLLLNSFNPYRLEGQKTLAYEVYEQLGGAPDYVFVPVGNAGNISAIYKGFRELRDIGLIDSAPIMVGVQASGAAPLANAFPYIERFSPVDEPRTLASAIRIGKPVNWRKAWRAVESSGGFFTSVEDAEILRAQMRLARKYGILVEPASAASYAGFLKHIDELDGRVVLVATGHGLKDPDVINHWSNLGII